MDKNIKAMKQLNLMVILTIITQIFMLLINALVASRFGVSAELDAFNLSKNISNFVYSFIGAGISAVLIPFLKEKKDKKAVNIFISVIYSICFLILILLLIFREGFISIVSGSSDIFFLEVASKIFIFTIISGFLNSLIQLAKAVLEFNGQFNRQKLIVLFTTFVLLSLLWLGNDKVSIFNYATFILVTTILSITIHFILLKRTTFSFSLNYDLSDDDFKGMMKLLGPTVLSAGVYQVSLLIDTLISARLDVGSISILSYANSVVTMINMLLLGNLTAFIYPRLVKETNESNRQKSLVDYVLFINAIMCLIIILFYIVGYEGISILFERGKFTSENTNIVYICALILVFALPTNGVRDLLYRYFYVNKDTYSPFVNSIMISLINIGISLILSSYIGLYGIVIGTVAASYLSLLFISLKFRRKFPIKFSKKYLIIENSKVILVTLLTVIISIVIKNLLIIENVFLGLLIYSILAFLVYVILLKAINSRVFKINI